jgi:hypothetical protein
MPTKSSHNNPNWKGGVCNLGHIDELLLLPEYMDSRRKKILCSHIVDAKGCWNWTAGVFKIGGRARISIGTNTTCAARVSYIVFKHEPIGDKLVCHSCDNVLCVNPEHLWLGTNADNSRDMSNKKRTKKQNGSSNSHSVLTEDDVVIVRELLAKGLTQRSVAAQYGVSNGTINQIHLRRTWKHI